MKREGEKRRGHTEVERKLKSGIENQGVMKFGK